MRFSKSKRQSQIQRQLTRTTDSRIRSGRDNAVPPIHIDEFADTTPPQISDTNTTLAKGVNLEIHLQSFGMYSFSITPNATGASTTFAQAAHKAIPLTGTVLPIINFVSNGVIRLANTVLHVVSNTLNATSAPAIKLTKLLAVPPGEHPTNTKPRNKCLPTSGYGKSNDRPTVDAASGINMN